MSLKSVSPDKYKGNYESDVVEQWKSCVEAATSITEHRANSNNVFITINSALLAVITYTLSAKSVLLSLVGITICVLWMRSIQSYHQLSSAKYHIINDIESLLPLAPFTHEWEQLKDKYHYQGLTNIEKLLPWLFVGIYILSILYPLFKLLLPLFCNQIGGVAS